MKTKLKIVVETACYYNSGNRGYNGSSGSCTYLNDEGNMCAVGRCMNEGSLQEVSLRERERKNKRASDGLSLAVDGLAKLYNGIDILLKPEYRGHDLEFWENMQCLHDNSRAWWDGGLTGHGLKQVEVLFGAEAKEAVEAVLACTNELL